jgi:hypothetical protein
MLVTGLTLGASACVPSVYQCSDNTECGGQGVCEASGFCSFEDASCESGRRYGTFAGDGLGGTCVGPLSGSSGAEVSSSSGGPEFSSTTSTSTSGTTHDRTTGGVLPGTSSTTSPDETTESSAGEGSSSTTGSTARVTDGLVLLYRFDEGDGLIVHDSSGVGTPLDLVLATVTTKSKTTETGTEWVQNGLRFMGNDTASRASSTSSVSKVRNACQKTDAISMEAWVTPADIDDPGPDRILSYSEDSSRRNFSLLVGRNIDGDQDPGWRARVRVGEKDVNGTPSLLSPADAADEGELAHVVFVHEASGAEAIYVDGVQTVSNMRPGDFADWANEGMVFSVGNELDGNRAFDGTLHLVAVYCRALDDAEVAQNFGVGHQ